MWSKDRVCPAALACAALATVLLCLEAPAAPESTDREARSTAANDRETRSAAVLAGHVQELRPWHDQPGETGRLRVPTPQLVKGYLKGQTHAHSSFSPDSQTPPADVIRWYTDHGYDFLVLTDHEHVTTVQQDGPLLVIPGAELTQNWYNCNPPPMAHDMCLLHANVLFVQQPVPDHIPWPSWRTRTRIGIYQRAIEASSRLGGILQLNHPNYHYAADAPLITELARRGVLLLEIANEAVDSNNQGDARHPSTEALWDAALTAGVTIFGVATDDAHHYYDARRARATGQLVHTGDRGFIMVHAEKTPESVRAAMTRGDFYSSNGVLLERIAVGRDALEVGVAQQARGVHQFTFIGRGGRVLLKAFGRQARFPLEVVRGGYVRAVVTDDKGRHAWVQPVRVP